MQRVLLIGSNPSEKSPDSSPFHTSTRSRMTIERWFENMNIEICFDNVCQRTRSENRPLRVSEIKAALPALNQRIQGYGENCKIVALGRTAERALKMLGVEFITMPHPSGRNRFWNNKEQAARKIKQLHEYINE